MQAEVLSTTAYRARAFSSFEELVIPPGCYVELPPCPYSQGQTVLVYGTLVAGRGWNVSTTRGSRATLTGCTIEGQGGALELTGCIGTLRGATQALAQHSTLELWDQARATIDEDPGAPRPSNIRMVGKTHCVVRRGKPRIFPAESAVVEAGGDAIVAPSGRQFCGRILAAGHAVVDWNAGVYPDDRFELVLAGDCVARVVLPAGELRAKATQRARLTIDARPQGRASLEIGDKVAADIGTNCTCTAAGDAHVTARGTARVRLLERASVTEVGDLVDVRQGAAPATR